MKSVKTSVILERSVLFKRQEVNIFIFKMVDNYFLKYTELLHPKPRQVKSVDGISNSYV